MPQRLLERAARTFLHGDCSHPLCGRIPLLAKCFGLAWKCSSHLFGRPLRAAIGNRQQRSDQAATTAQGILAAFEQDQASPTPTRQKAQWKITISGC